MSAFQTDALRPSSLPTASLGRRRPLDLSAGTSGVSEDLDKVAEEWNVRIDKEMKAMTSGLAELVDLADIGERPNPDTAQINALHLKIKTSQLIRSAQGLRDIAHELKLMLLLSDPVEEVKARDAEAARVGREVEQGRKDVVEGVRRLLGTKPAQTETPIEVDITDQQDKNGAATGHEKGDGEDRVDEHDEDEDDDGFEQVA